MQTYISWYTLGVFQKFPQFISRSPSKPAFGGHWFIPRGCPINTGFTASLRAVTGLNVWRSLPHNERL